MKISINVLYRSNLIYNDIDDILSIINSNTNLEVNIYNYLNTNVLPKYNNIDFDKTLTISRLIKKIFDESDDETYKIILDSNIKYNNINIDSINTNNNLIRFMMINNYIFPFTIGGTNYYNNIIDTSYMVTYSDTSLVISMDKGYLNNYYEKDDYCVSRLFYEFLHNNITEKDIDTYIVYFDENNIILNDIEILYKNAVLITLKCDNYKQILLESLTKYNNSLMFYILLHNEISNNNLNEQPSEYYKNVLRNFYVAENLNNFTLNNYKFKKNNTINNDDIIIYCAIFLRNKISKFVINDIYKIKIIKNIDNVLLNEYYSNITKEIVKLEKKTLNVDKNLKYNLDEKWIYNDSIFPDVKKISDIGGILHYNNTRMHYVYSDNILKFYPYNSEINNALSMSLILHNYKILNNFIKFNNSYITAVYYVNDNCTIMKFLILDSELQFKCFTRNIRINTTQNIEGIFTENNDIGLFYIENNTINKVIFNSLKLYTQLFEEINIENNIIFKINKKIRVNLIIDNCDLCQNFEYKNYNFTINESDDCRNNIRYNGNFFIYNNNKIFSHSKFIYFPNVNLPKAVKTHELCFHKNCVHNELYKKSEEFGLSISPDYVNSKYYIIKHKDFENLTSSELSLIINNNCLIISLLELSDTDDIETKIYSSDSNLSNLFLFNIVKNDTYIQFIFDKIIHENQYLAREELMEIDKIKLMDKSSIYKICGNFLKDPDNSINIKITDDNKKVFTSIKSKLINTIQQSQYKCMCEIIKYIIKLNYTANIYIYGFPIYIEDNITELSDTNVRENLETRKIFNIIRRINFIGETIYNSKSITTKNNIIISNTIHDISDIKLPKKSLIFIVETNNAFFN